MRLTRSGKVKDIYELDSGNILFHFSDRISAFDVKMATPIPKKGEVLCKFAEFWFDTLQTPNHMLKVVAKDKMEVKKLQMIPLECVVRGYFYGSYVERYKEHLGKELPSSFRPVLGSKLPEPIFDPTTKSEEHDRPIDRHRVVSSGILSDNDYDFLERTSLSLYKKMSNIVERAGFIIADVKFEFGVDEKGSILLGDSLGPDEYRLWLKTRYQPGKIQESYDKQLLRDWLIEIGFKDTIDRLAMEGKKPESPQISSPVVNELSRRYMIAYEQISGRRL
ncbi:MAG: phosphoribosylaminoimidazolesuccinocarboxamide synthase [Thermoproteota archaeon]|jgi:phosphoribosylaminoimidazole-succinocarboxamide synthase|nr:phosphoribosylaminoimidazolesuccinocarboxamide synthase [Thermoproteota archaeon]